MKNKIDDKKRINLTNNELFTVLNRDLNSFRCSDNEKDEKLILNHSLRSKNVINKINNKETYEKMEKENFNNIYNKLKYIEEVDIDIEAKEKHFKTLKTAYDFMIEYDYVDKLVIVFLHYLIKNKKQFNRLILKHFNKIFLSDMELFYNKIKDKLINYENIYTTVFDLIDGSLLKYIKYTQKPLTKESYNKINGDFKKFYNIILNNFYKDTNKYISIFEEFEIKLYKNTTFCKLQSMFSCFDDKVFNKNITIENFIYFCIYHSIIKFFAKEFTKKYKKNTTCKHILEELIFYNKRKYLNTIDTFNEFKNYYENDYYKEKDKDIILHMIKTSCDEEDKINELINNLMITNQLKLEIADKFNYYCNDMVCSGYNCNNKDMISTTIFPFGINNVDELKDVFSIINFSKSIKNEKIKEYYNNEKYKQLFIDIFNSETIYYMCSNFANSAYYKGTELDTQTHLFYKRYMLCVNDTFHNSLTIEQIYNNTPEENHEIIREILVFIVSSIYRDIYLKVLYNTFKEYIDKQDFDEETLFENIDTKLNLTLEDKTNIFNNTIEYLTNSSCK